MGRERRLALLVLAAIAGLSYGWALGRDPLEPYYAASVRSMSMSWHNFFFASFDPAGSISLDKLPGAFWVQALAVRAFGAHTWVMVAPQVIEGVLTMLVLYRAVQRLAGPTAGLIAALILAASPATVALNRGNISDSLMILFLVLAADAVSSAITSGSQTHLILAAVWVGLAFQTKMIEAWILLPALGVAYLLCGPEATRRRVRQLVIAGVVAGVVSLTWMTAVTLTSPSRRPYVDGSHSNSIYDQVFVYNGFGRFGEQTPLQLLAGQSLGLTITSHPGPAGPQRLLRGDLGRDTGWLVPAAIVVAVWGIVTKRRDGWDDPLRACFVLWGGWLLLLGIAFSVTTTINSYYTAALTPALAAILGAGLVDAWSRERSAIRRRVGLAVVVAGTVAYAVWLVPGSGTHVPGWLAPAVVAIGFAAVLTILASLVVRADALFVAALVGGVIAGLLAPAVASAELVSHHEGAFDTPFESSRQAGDLDNLFVRTPSDVKATIPRLESDQRGAPYLLATQTSAIASVFIDDSGREALPIGGFTGTMPSPTLSQLKSDVREGRFHLVLAATSSDPRLVWIADHCLHVGATTGALHSYFCLPGNAG